MCSSWRAKGNRGPKVHWIPSAWVTRPHVFKKERHWFSGSGGPMRTSLLWEGRSHYVQVRRRTSWRGMVTALIIYLSHLGKMPSTVPSCHHSTKPLLQKRSLFGVERVEKGDAVVLPAGHILTPSVPGETPETSWWCVCTHVGTWLCAGRGAQSLRICLVVL